MITFSHIANSDAIYVICKFLEPKDIVNLLHVYSKNNRRGKMKKVENCLKNRTAENLDQTFRKVFKNKYENFKENMIKSGAIVSGSVILQVLFGEVWKTKLSRIDVDIFVPVKPIYDEKILEKRDKEYTFYNCNSKFKLGYTSLHNFMYECVLESHHNTRMNIYENTYETHSQYRDELGKDVIVRVNEYVLSDKLFRFEIVEINKDKFINDDKLINECKLTNEGKLTNECKLTNEGKLTNECKLTNEGKLTNEDNWEKIFVNKHTDFNICKNYFQYTQDGSLNIYFEDLESVIHKKAKFNYVNDINKSLERCKKYVERGFMFTADEKLDDSKARKFFQYFLESCNPQK